MTGTTESGGGRDLRLTSVTKRFGDFVAVDDLSLTVPRGSFFALLGPSGCGKTTTLRMVAGLEEPTAGNIAIGDEDITWNKPYKRPVNTVFQSYALFPHLDIYENVAFGLRRRGIKDVKKQVEDMLELVEQQDLGSVDQRPGHGHPLLLAPGELRRLAPGEAGELDQLEHVLDLLLDVLDPPTPQPERDVLVDVEVGEQGVALEHGVDRSLVRLVPGDVLAADGDVARRRLLQAGDHPQRRRLAAAGGTEQREERTARHGQAQVVDSHEVAEAFRDAGQPQVAASPALGGSSHRL